MGAPCPFCEIVASRAPAEVIYRGVQAVAFSPLKPAAIGHTLVVPRWHVATLEPFLRCASRDGVRSLGIFMEELGEVSELLTAQFQPDGMNLIQSSGAAASQTVMHLHFHLVPRFHGDHLGDIWEKGRTWWNEVEGPRIRGLAIEVEKARGPVT